MSRTITVFIGKELKVNMFKKECENATLLFLPETGLHPTRASELVIDLVSKRTKNLVIATHSPYVLTTLNNLLEAGIIERKLKELKDKKGLSRLYRIVRRKHIIKPSLISAYEIVGDVRKSIMDEESELILAECIDDVSNDLSIQFGKLLDLKYQKREVLR